MTSDAVNPHKSDQSDEGRQLSPEQAAAAAMVAEARQRGLELTGPDGLLKLFTKNVLETALNEEITRELRSGGLWALVSPGPGVTKPIITAVSGEQDHIAGGGVVGHRRVDPGGWAGRGCCFVQVEPSQVQVSPSIEPAPSLP